MMWNFYLYLLEQVLFGEPKGMQKAHMISDAPVGTNRNREEQKQINQRFSYFRAAS